jgi:anaerobic selenocysteine-containing dehydrogenase
VDPPSLSLHRVDLDRLGVPSGTVVDVTGAHGTLPLPVVLDDGVCVGTGVIAFGSLTLAGDDVVATLVDFDSVFSQVRLETR